jgi:integrase
MNELRCLHHEEIFLDATEPYVRVVRDNNRELKTRTPRTPPISMGFAAELRRRCIGRPRTGPIFPAGGHAKEARHSSSLYVGHKALERWMDHAREAAGLGDDVTFITLRHTYASWLIQGGVSIAKVARWMGHSVTICWKHYAGLIPGGDRDVEKGFHQKTPPRVSMSSEIPTPAWGHTPPLGSPKA